MKDISYTNGMNLKSIFFSVRIEIKMGADRNKNGNVFSAIKIENVFTEPITMDKIVCTDVVELLVYLAELVERTSNREEIIKDFNDGFRKLVSLIDENAPTAQYCEFVRTKLVEFSNSNSGRTPVEYMRMAMEAANS